jgi:diguanylate cyclase (GGDEF)-like protein/PAS domain S-box-containing protein
MPSFLRAKRLLWGVIFGLLTVTGWASFVSGRQYVRAQAEVEQTLEAHSVLDVEQRRELQATRAGAERALGRARWAIVLGSTLAVALSLLSLLTVHRDVETVRRATEDLAASEEHFRLITENGSDLVRTHDLDAKPLYVSPSVERILGYTPSEFLQFAPLALVHPDDKQVVAPSRTKPISERYKNTPLEYRLRHKNGTYRWLEVNFGSLRDAAGNIVGIQSAGRDVTARRSAEERLAAQTEQLRNLSLRDELTELYNRRGFLELATQALRLASREQRTAAVIFCDLNGMKEINDRNGHEEGDRALKDTADMLRGACREVDVVARFGGDEFVIFALDVTESGLLVLRERVRASLAELNGSGERPFFLSLSVGAAFFRPDRSETIQQLLDRADAEMYERKRARRASGGLSVPPPASS